MSTYEWCNVCLEFYFEHRCSFNNVLSVQLQSPSRHECYIFPRIRT